MSRSHASSPLPKQGRRHPLLFQQCFNEQNFWATVSILGISAALVILNPDRLAPYRIVILPALVCSGLILALTFVFRLRAYAQCLPDGLRLQLPFYRLTIPYREIRATRPTVLYEMFTPERQRWPQRRFLRRLFGATVVVVELDALPASRRWLRLWLNKYMLCPDRTGLVVAVRDWMAFRSELDEFIARLRRL